MEEDVRRGQRRITLLCPSLPKLTHIIAWDDHKLDIGSIAHVFGLEPNSLKLNGHFISRGVDLLASSVTWRSLIGFFSSRGLSTGVSDSSPLVVDGKPARIGSKRLCGPEEASNCVIGAEGQGDTIRKSKRPQLESKNGLPFQGGLVLKRKNGLEDESSAKRPKPNLAASGVEERRGLTSNSVLPCGFMRKTIKRMRDLDDGDDMFAVVSPLKKKR